MASLDKEEIKVQKEIPMEIAETEVIKDFDQKIIVEPKPKRLSNGNAAQNVEPSNPLMV